MTKTKTITVRYTPWRYTGWRALWRKITFRPTESDTYEFEAIPPGTTWHDKVTNSDETTFDLKPVGPVRKVNP